MSPLFYCDKGFTDIVKAELFGDEQELLTECYYLHERRNKFMAQEYPYSAADIDLTRIDWSRFCHFDAIHAPNGDAMIRVFKEKKLVLALRFDKCSPSRLHGICHRWGQAYYSVYGLEDRCGMKSSVKERTDWSDIVPVTKVDALPELEMWETTTRWSEDAFWASPEMRILVNPENTGCCIQLLELTGAEVGSYRFTCSMSRDKGIERLALYLKERLHLTAMIRFEERMKDKLHGLCAWYR